MLKNNILYYRKLTSCRLEQLQFPDFNISEPEIIPMVLQQKYRLPMPPVNISCNNYNRETFRTEDVRWLNIFVLKFSYFTVGKFLGVESNPQ